MVTHSQDTWSPSRGGQGSPKSRRHGHPAEGVRGHPNPDVMVTQPRGSGVTQPGVIQTTCATSGGGHYLSTARIHNLSSSQANIRQQQ